MSVTKCEDGAFVVWCFFIFFYTKTVASATEYSYRLLHCHEPQFGLFDP